jgi:hypothetical protein
VIGGRRAVGLLLQAGLLALVQREAGVVVDVGQHAEHGQLDVDGRELVAEQRVARAVQLASLEATARFDDDKRQVVGYLTQYCRALSYLGAR